MPVKITEQQQDVLKFAKANPVGVLATASKHGVPHAASVYYVFDEDMNVYFITKEETKKFRNLKENHHVALASFKESTQTTLQIVGEALHVKDVDMFIDVFEHIIDICAANTKSDRLPISKLFAGDYYLYQIKPSSIRLAEYLRPDQGNLMGLFEVVKP